jgi:hypothetical protein
MGAKCSYGVWERSAHQADTILRTCTNHPKSTRVNNFLKCLDLGIYFINRGGLLTGGGGYRCMHKHPHTQEASRLVPGWHGQANSSKSYTKCVPVDAMGPQKTSSNLFPGGHPTSQGPPITRPMASLKSASGLHKVRHSMQERAIPEVPQGWLKGGVGKTYCRGLVGDARP